MKLYFELVQNVRDFTFVGDSKRTDKLNGNLEHNAKIYSWSYSNDVQKEAREFGKFIQKIDPKTRHTVNIKQEHYREFLNEKKALVNEGKLAPETYNKHVTLLTKLSEINHAKFSRATRISRKDFPHLERGTTQRDVSLSDKVGNVVVRDMLEHGRGSNAWKAVVLSVDLGLRNKETVEVRKNAFHLEQGGKWGFGYVELEGKRDGCKGGRNRHVDVLSKKEQQELKKLIKGLEPSDRVVAKPDGSAYTTNAITKAVQRSFERVGLGGKEFTGNKQHSFRKGFAQRSYDVERKATIDSPNSKKDAMDYSNAQLGHGKNRVDDNKRYVANAW